MFYVYMSGEDIALDVCDDLLAAQKQANELASIFQELVLVTDKPMPVMSFAVLARRVNAWLYG